MDKMLVVVFENEQNGYEGARALQDLHNKGKITLYSKSLIKKNPDGRVSTIDESEKGPVGTAVGILTGALIGVLGGPVGVAVGGYVGTVGGMLYDLAKIGVSDEFIEDVGQYLLEGKVAVVAEIREESVEPVDTAMGAIGGVVFRQARSETVDSQFDRDSAEFRAEISQLEDEMDKAADDAKATLQAKLDAAKAKLHATQEKAKAEAEEAKRETEAKINSLKEQIKKANAETKAKLEKRVSEIQAEHEKRVAKLRQSWEATQEASANWRYTQTHV